VTFNETNHRGKSNRFLTQISCRKSDE